MRRGNGVILTAAVVLAAGAACSPEARRVRDGGPGADPGNKILVVHDFPDPQAADTTLWPGRNPAPTDRLAKGIVPPPTYPAPGNAPRQRAATPVTPTVPRSEPQQRSYDGGRTADPRWQTH